ncbi:ParB N-terminal domain-containing protein [Bacillus atrophaeus]|uniref:DNA methyltransferase n=1 Tax=Bacillus atrophaeus TaxID=1452 RepID=UPI003990DBDC
MIIKSIPVKKINPAPYNPRIDLQPGDPEYDALKKSIEQFGYIDPLIWNEKTGNLVGGHQRYKILMEESPKEITVSVVSLDESKEKALNIALNKISGNWDEEKLEKVLSELKEANFEMSFTGFSDEEYKELLANLPSDTEIDTVEEDDFDVKEALDKITEPETKYGDKLQLGRHILVCGDATKLEDVKKLMGENKAALIVTDPPYNVAVRSDSKKLNDAGHASILNDKMGATEFVEFLRAVFINYFQVMSDDAAIYLFHPSSFQVAFENEMRSAGMEIRSQCVWVKNAPTFGWSNTAFSMSCILHL